MVEDTNATIVQTNIGLAALLDLLEEKAVITEAEYTKKFDESKKVALDLAVEELKKKFE